MLTPDLILLKVGLNIDKCLDLLKNFQFYHIFYMNKTVDMKYILFSKLERAYEMFLSLDLYYKIFLIFFPKKGTSFVKRWL